jgi:LPXTG-motif cell wall-anchored protein
MLRRFALLAALTTGLLLPAAAASAESADYPGGTETSVLGENVDRGTVDPQQVSGVADVRSAPASQSLPVTGTDVAQLAGIGVVLVAGGTVLVRRSRRSATVTA